ncbi:MAG: N-acetylglucosamine kinase [Rhodothermaceae bacterium]
MKYYIGIDGGGTKTNCILTDENLNVLAEHTNGSGAFLIHGTDEVVEKFHNSISECITTAKINHKNISAIVIGCAGAGTPENAEKLRTAFLKYSLSQGINYSNINVTGDAVIALEGAFSGKPGAILIAGTGSVLFGKDNDNQIHRIGGAGRIIGDEGSGFIIGQKALNAVFRYFDGRGQETSLTDILNTELDINNIETFIDKIYNVNVCPSKIAPFVIKAAENDDQVSIHILEEQALELAKHVQVMQKKITGKLYLSFMGGLLSNNYYRNLVKKLVNILAPGTEVKEPENSPVTGAVILAKNFSKTYDK